MINRPVLLCLMFIVALSSPAFGADSDAGGPADDAFITIEGVGYPPIRAESPAQARLLARRAAVLDAYRNALAEKGINDYEEAQLYSELEGFVSGMEVLEEEYLDDGGIRVVARVLKRDVVVRSAVISGQKQETRKNGPSRVSLEEWYTVIRKFVRFDN